MYAHEVDNVNRRVLGGVEGCVDRLNLHEEMPRLKRAYRDKFVICPFVYLCVIKITR